MKNLFENRHIGPNAKQTDEMLSSIGVNTLDELISQTIPSNIRLGSLLNLPKAMQEEELLSHLHQLAKKNKIFKSYIGMGYYGTYTPKVILRNILENPGWYTAYTPYQAEIAQGRLEMLLNFQTMIIDLTGMEIANASLLDEGTAAAEALSMMFALRAPSKKNINKCFVSSELNPQTIDLLLTRATPLGIQLVVESADGYTKQSDYFGAIFAYPSSSGELIDLEPHIQYSKDNQILTTVVSDLLALCLLKSPGNLGADVVVGSAQRFGVPMGFGGPHAAFFATKEAYKRFIPGRIIGVSVDAQGNKAYRMALQTREQHIKREKATSNICTAQVLLSVMAAAYAVYHGSEGLKNIAQQVHYKANSLASSLKNMGFNLKNTSWFDTLTILVNDTHKLRTIAEAKEINFRYNQDSVGISIDETTQIEDLNHILSVFSEFSQKDNNLLYSETVSIPETLLREHPILQQKVFNTYLSEHQMLRYLKSLENKDLSMVHSMISLGSCTMKLNATTEMIPVTWPEFSALHPFIPENQALGYKEIFTKLEAWLAEITGFDAVSLQPNSGAQGEYAGLMVIRAYHEHHKQANRNVALIPSSAHGTNPASAVMAGMKVIVTKCDEQGNIDLEDLYKNAELHKDNLACLMVTYPSTHGVFEEKINQITDIIHSFGGLVYMDGANMNAQVGLTSPGKIGADVCHLNLHKTFCIPHGGGGPGMGPIGVVAKLAPFLPGHAVVKTGGEHAISAISAAPYGSASILLISYAYICMMGAEGLTNATKYAILNANYIKELLMQHYPILYAGANGRCAHEMIVDCRHFKITAGIEVEDIAKRLMDYGFHAPTVSFPVAGTLMIEPTESEPKEELDRFVEAMIAIRAEIAEIEQGLASKESNVLKNAPHTAQVLLSDEWSYAYTRAKAAYPLEWVRNNKFWPTVSRIDGAYGDRNLVCTCEPIESYQS